MKRLKISELLRDNIIDAIETSRKATVAIANLRKTNVIDSEILDEIDYVYDGLYKLLWVLYPIETASKDFVNYVYDTFQLYLEGDPKGPQTLDEFFKMIEED